MKVLLVTLLICFTSSALAASDVQLERLLKLVENLEDKNGGCGTVDPTAQPKNLGTKALSVDDGHCGIQNTRGKSTLNKLLDLIKGDAPITKDKLNKIVDGAPANANEWPWAVSVQNVGDGLGMSLHKCGGSLVHKQWVLTSARCLFPNGLESSFDTCGIQVAIAEYNIQTWDDFSTEEKVVNVVAHPQFDAATGANDIVLLKMENMVDINKYPWRETLCLNSLKTPMFGEKCKVIGWGKTGEKEEDVTRLLQNTDVTVMKAEKCDGVQLETGQLCAGDIGKEVCEKDIGGPLFCPSKYKQWVQVGIVSGAQPCSGSPSGYGVYTDVANYITWIGDVIRSG